MKGAPTGSQKNVLNFMQHHVCQAWKSRNPPLCTQSVPLPSALSPPRQVYVSGYVISMYSAVPGSAMNWFCITGTFRSAGVIFVDLLHEFGAGASVSAIMFGLQALFIAIGGTTCSNPRLVMYGTEAPVIVTAAVNC